MNIFLLAYTRQNLGDDLFIKILLEQYPHCDFYIKIKDPIYLKYFFKYPNLHITVGDNSLNSICSMNIDDYDAFVYIGGSIFMEGKSGISNKFYDFLDRLRNRSIPFYYISCNYGPYQTKEFFNLSKKSFHNVKDICFRDRYSYNLFNQMDTVRYAPDLIFSHDLKSYKKIANSIGISVINLDKKLNSQQLKSAYYDFLVNNINNFISQGKKVYLFSFCKYEGDEIVIDEVLKHFNQTRNITCCNYDGNLDKFIKLYGQMEYALCSRFHAMVLSSIFQQRTFVLSYSEKIDSVIKDLDLGYNVINFGDNINNIVILDNLFMVINNEDLLKIRERAKDQLKAFDELVK